MNVERAINLGKTLLNYFPAPHLFAIGGYPSLVKQGVLKEERETKDIDFAVFRKNNSDLGWRMRDQLQSERNDASRTLGSDEGRILHFLISESECAYSEGIKKTCGMETFITDQYMELVRLGVNKSTSIKLTNISDISMKPQAKEAIREEGFDYITQMLLAGGNQVTYTQPSAVGTVHEQYQIPIPFDHEVAADFVKKLTNYEKLMTDVNDRTSADEFGTLLETLRDIRFNVSYKIKYETSMTSHARVILETEILRIDRSVNAVYGMISLARNRDAKKLDSFFRENYSSNYLNLSSFFTESKERDLKIDIFTLEPKKMDKMTVIIDKNRFVHYYLILKAKYEYCKNLTTDENSFNKHLADLIKSYNTKKILGVNYPVDIDFLVNNRERDGKGK